MNNVEVVKRLKQKYPGRNIILNNSDKPTEVVCEINPENGEAVAVIDRSILHYHKYTTEYYSILEGELELFVDDKKYVLKKGDEFTIEPNKKHYAVGSATWVFVKSTPPWSAEDHFEI